MSHKSNYVFVIRPKVSVVNYPTIDLHDNGYLLVARCDRQDIRVLKYIAYKKKLGFEVKVLKEHPKNVRNNIIHIWARKNDPNKV